MMSPELLFWYELALKMAMTAAIVVIASVAVERSGPFIGALIAALPTAAGAAYIILAIEHPPSFIASSAIGSLATGAAVSIFALSYAILAQRHGLMLSLGVATVLWFAVALALRFVDWTPLTAVALNAVVFAVTIPLSWRYRTSGPPPKVVRTRLDIPLRALTAAVVVAIVTTASHRIGSFASGMFAVFPIVLGSFIVILHPRIGGKASASVLAHAQVAFIGLSLSWLALYYLAEPLGVWWGMAISLCVGIAWNLMLWALRALKSL
jgi:uncharacterized membrane protein (GlpM family)